MNEQINDGGSAFPSHGTMGEVVQDGMNLRDYFAAKALQGALAYPGSTNAAHKIAEYAQFSYKVADAMLAARNPP